MSDEPRGPHAPPQGSGDRPAAPPPGLPRHRRGTAPQGRSRYPDYDVLEEAGHWDEATRKVVLDRVENVPPVRFFDAREEATMRAFCDVVTAQDREPRVPVLEMVDAKLHAGRLDGFQYADMPDDRDVWRRAAKGLDDVARARGAESFARAPDAVKLEIVAAFHKGTLAGGVWDEMPAAKAFSVLMRAVLSAFYSHPWAWNEIGFGGPAYPRGYARLGIGLREAWEGEEEFDVDPVRDVQERGVDL
jgi:Gluconate 2-dehydrogenase subunit 3